MENSIVQILIYRDRFLIIALGAGSRHHLLHNCFERAWVNRAICRDFEIINLRDNDADRRAARREKDRE